ncbi:MAG: sulfate ABC transporter ATP-binding protein [Synechococcaceae cyanobacterium RM1_1_27]|nr:sulfate ABC transporter ATP-binding protein [Synechococcaceae cyanobacterium SM2_3_2]NJO85945.1 sulfate ABC transporter ATP-binding protein [Synechococcaceae cyanobacterium RM1_1_27]
MGITVEGVSKRFGEFQALRPTDLTIETGSLVALLGPSGSGKSTLLRLIAGLEVPDTGRILLTGRDATYATVQDRNIGFVFQHYALFKHMTVRQNVAFGLEIRKASRAEIRARVDELLELVQLSGFGDRYPSQLSGGQRQRIALARSLAVEPQVLLLDEPFGALDAKVRKELRAWLRRLHDEVHVTTVFVTHDQEEAMEVADEIVVMSQGQIEQVGSPAEIYDHPASPFVMSFIGQVNVLDPESALSCQLPEYRGGSHQVFMRPHDVQIEFHPHDNCVPAQVKDLIHLGREIQAELVLQDGTTLWAHLSREQYGERPIQKGQSIYVSSRAIKTFPSDLPDLAQTNGHAVRRIAAGTGEHR